MRSTLDGTPAAKRKDPRLRNPRSGAISVLCARGDLNCPACGYIPIPPLALIPDQRAISVPASAGRAHLDTAQCAERGTSNGTSSTNGEAMTRHWHDAFGRYLETSEELIFLKVNATEDGTPYGLNLDWRSALALAEGLRAACTALEHSFPRRCGCGAPTPSDEPTCVECELLDRAAHRQSLRARNGLRP